MNEILEANLEDLKKIYYEQSRACEALTVVIDHSDGRSHENLEWLLRHHEQAPITRQDEIVLRDAFDELINFCSLLEIAQMSSFVPRPDDRPLWRDLRVALMHPAVRTYYEKHYPQWLPQLFYLRLEGGFDRAENDQTAGNSLFLGLLALDQRFMRELGHGVFLRMLDDFIIDGHEAEEVFAELLRTLKDQRKSMNLLMRPPKRRGVIGQALNDLGLLLQFCADFEGLLLQSGKHRLLQSELWHYYSYWFALLGRELDDALRRTLAHIGQWRTEQPSKDSIADPQAAVQSELALLDRLRSTRYAEPVVECVRAAKEHRKQ